jgi:hypothetical protein
MSTENFKQSPGKRSITFCRGLTHWLSKAEFESVKASGMFGEFYPGQPDRWEDLPDQGATPAPTHTPTPLASTAMEAARELRAYFNKPLLSFTGAKDDPVYAIIACHFQPLLTKVEDSKHVPTNYPWLETAHFLPDSADTMLLAWKRGDHVTYRTGRYIGGKFIGTSRDEFRTQPNYYREVTGLFTSPDDITALRADLAAKEAAQTEMKECLRNMAHKLNAVLGLNERECAYLNQLQEQDDLKSALASRADKGGAR